MKCLDADRHVMMREMIESEGDAEYVLRKSCENVAKRYEEMKKRLSEKIPYVRPTKILYEINGREGTVYSMTGDEKIVTEIHVCTPVRIPFSPKRRAVSEI